MEFPPTLIPTQVQLKTKYQSFDAGGELEPESGGNESLCGPVQSPLAVGLKQQPKGMRLYGQGRGRERAPEPVLVPLFLGFSGEPCDSGAARL